MFRATSAYVLSVVPQNVDAQRMIGSLPSCFLSRSWTINLRTRAIARERTKRSYVKSFRHAADVCKML